MTKEDRRKDMVRRCIMDFVRRGGIDESNAEEVAARVLETLAMFEEVTVRQ